MNNEEENKKKVNETHLGYIQAVIDRMGQNSFHAKEWSVTVVSALIAFYLTKDAEESRFVIVITAGVVTILFGLIDAYYLHLERGYRQLYKVVAQLESDSSIKPYSMNRPNQTKGFCHYMKAFVSVSTGLFYLVILLGIIALYIFTNIQ